MAKKSGAGALRKLLVFEKPTRVQDSTGQDIPDWSDVYTVWGSVEPLKGQVLNLAQANTVTKTSTHQITVRYNPDLVGKSRYRIRLGADLSFCGLTSEQFAGLTSEDFARLVSCTTPPRYFTINQTIDREERHQYLDIIATEVLDG